MRISSSSSAPTTLMEEARDSGLLLELAAADDVAAFRRAVEQEKLPIDSSLPWYGRWISSSSKKPVMGYQRRTPLMVASLYGSVSVLEYILSSMSSVDVGRRCGTDSTTALHCAAAGGSDSSLHAARLLLDAAADINAVDASGNRPVDVIARQKPGSGKAKLALEAALGGTGKDVDTESISSLSSSPVTPKQQQLHEKKEYPVDSTLPDIKSGIYGTDEFRMYTFKVKPCSRAYSHDWTECPFVHPGENARRRDPRKYHYSCVPCPEFRKGSCRNGDSCEYAHGVFESWLHPAQYRTRLCKDETGCNRRVCFFAHKPEELRPLYPSSGSPGSIVSSPRSAANLPPLDLGAAASALLMNHPISPSSSSALATAVWLKQNGGIVTPTSQLPSSRLKSSLSARDMDLDFDTMGLDGGYQKQLQHQKLIDEIGNLSFSRGSDYGDTFGSPDSNLVSPAKGLSLKSQFQSPVPKHQNLTQQLLSGYNATGNLTSSPSALSSSPSLASTLMNSRATAFAKRSQSFIDRGAVNRHSAGMVAPTNLSSTSPSISDWGSPNGKLDWGIQGDELNKLRKSASFGIRGNGTHMGGGGLGSAAAPEMSMSSDEPDVSWVQSMVKDGLPAGFGFGADQNPKYQQQQQFHLNKNGAGEFQSGDMFSPWTDQQLYLEQEQMVA